MSYFRQKIAKKLKLHQILENKRATLLQKNGMKSLKEIVNLLGQHKIFYWIDAGTLLGIVRDKKFIKKDTDIDIAVVLENPDVLYEILLENEYNIWYYYHNNQGEKRLIRAEKHGVGIDFEIFYKNQKYYYDAPRELPPEVDALESGQKAVLRFQFDSEVIEQQTTRIFNGISLKIPENYDIYFDVYYTNWKKKTKKTNYLNSYFLCTIDKYKHHNESAYYVKDSYLYFTEVNPSSIRLQIKDIVYALLWRG